MGVNAKLLGRLLSEHGAALMLFARQWCDTPEDAVQEAFLGLCKLRQPPERIVSWLFAAVRNAAIDASRIQTRRRRLAEQHRDQRRPRGEALAVAIRAVLPDMTDEFPARNQRKHLTEQVGAVFHIGGLLSGQE